MPFLGPQSVENCMCVLHNLSYRLDAEVPTRYRQLEYNARNTYTEKSSTGCFSNKSDKMMVSTASAGPGPAPSSIPPGATASSALSSGPSWSLKPALRDRPVLRPWSGAHAVCQELSRGHSSCTRGNLPALLGSVRAQTTLEVKNSSPLFAGLGLSYCIMGQVSPIFSLALENLRKARTLTFSGLGSHHLLSSPRLPQKQKPAGDGQSGLLHWAQLWNPGPRPPLLAQAGSNLLSESGRGGSIMRGEPKAAPHIWKVWAKAALEHSSQDARMLSSPTSWDGLEDNGPFLHPMELLQCVEERGAAGLS